MSKFLSHSDMQRILEEAKDNLRRLENCPPPHDFIQYQSPIANGKPTRYRCTKCGGDISLEAHTWYQRGRDHGK